MLIELPWGTVLGRQTLRAVAEIHGGGSLEARA